VTGTGNQGVVENLARKGVPCLIVNRSADGLDRLRSEFPKVPFCCISPDQVEVGRTQGRQFLRLHDRDGFVLYVQGPVAATAAQQRLSGMREVLRASKVKDRCVCGDWVSSKAASAVETWFAANPAGAPLPAVIGCQNDAMAMGAREALERVSAKKGDPSIRRIPITGCDGTPDYGARLVREGKLAATIELGDPMETSFGVLERYFQRGEVPPVQVKLGVRSLPDLTRLNAA
jgi:ABC-type sugar transport system substrate-binding protein